ncbi:carbohydrate kinase [Rhizobium sp. TH2]|uniref:xylulokinase n=1 Tax=Rhizobium sp. TH2 TaxID=2775403 RepID=UPI0021571341|nr:FGGY-family carbohydrate kinase [Rhizobium sp. TH2]UVC09270.1 carbohydrate kinase [Rhizobium sp. TH2]
MNDARLIGIDVGTTAVKAALYDIRGQALKTYAQSYPMHRTPPDRVEQDPADWMTHVLAALGHLTEGLGDGQLQGVGLTSQVNSHVFVDENGKELMPAIIWQDGRCAGVAAEIDAHLDVAEKIGWWGAPLPVDASHVLARMEWVRRNRPEIWAKTRWVMAPKDYCILQLTGEVVADPMASFGVIDQSLAYIESLIALVDGARGRLAPLRPFTAAAGRIKAGLPGAGALLVTGTMDAWAGVVGAGAVNDGDGLYLSGTSEILGVVSKTKMPVPGVIAFPRCEEITFHAGPTQAGGASIAWLSNLLGRTPADLSALASDFDRSRMPPIFLPHLQGERAPVWNASARASFSGVDSSMGPAEFTVAVMEGVAFSARLSMDALQKSADVVVENYRAAGGGMGSDIWCQIRADVLGKPVMRLKNLDAGVLGAAILAGVGTGLFSSIRQAAAALVAIDRSFEPDASLAARYDYAYGKYRELYGQLEAFNAELVAHSR